jgi:hypothetical protein
MKTLYRPKLGERVPVVGCYSEAMMHLGVAGQPIQVALVEQKNLRGETIPGLRPMAQIYHGNRPYSFPVLPGEAGFYEDEEGFYCYVSVATNDAQEQQHEPPILDGSARVQRT